MEDEFNQLIALSEDDLGGFVNVFGFCEAGIDGCGIFKDLQEYYFFGFLFWLN